MKEYQWTSGINHKPTVSIGVSMQKKSSFIERNVKKV